MKRGGTPKFKYKRVKIIWQDIVSNSEWMTLEEYRKEKGLSYYNFGLELGIQGVQNPGTSVQRWCLTAKVKRFPDPEMVKKIIEVTKNKVTIKDLYESWWNTQV